MLLDNSLNLDIAVALTTSGSSTNYIDTIGASGGQTQISTVNTIQGGGDAYEQLWAEILITTTVTGTASATIDFQIWTSPVLSLIWTTGNAGSLPTIVGQTFKLAGTGIVKIAALTASTQNLNSGGYVYKQRLAQGVQRYISAFYNIQSVASGLTAGAWSCILVPDVDINLT